MKIGLSIFAGIVIGWGSFLCVAVLVPIQETKNIISKEIREVCTEKECDCPTEAEIFYDNCPTDDYVLRQCYGDIEIASEKIMSLNEYIVSLENEISAYKLAVIDLQNKCNL